MAEKILLVDDDSNVLDGYRRSLGKEFQMETALGSKEALALATEKGPYAVVISDMRMPGMDGIQLLSHIKTIAPDTIRVMLTGNADMDTAINAINEGSIFRFLNKPCSKEVMARTITAALVQYRLVTAEKTASRTDSRGDAASTHPGAEPGQSRSFRPGRAGPALHPSHCNFDEVGKHVAVRGCRDVVTTGLRDAGSGNHRGSLSRRDIAAGRAGAI